MSTRRGFLYLLAFGGGFAYLDQQSDSDGGALIDPPETIDMPTLSEIKKTTGAKTLDQTDTATLLNVSGGTLLAGQIHKPGQYVEELQLSAGNSSRSIELRREYPTLPPIDPIDTIQISPQFADGQDFTWQIWYLES